MQCRSLGKTGLQATALGISVPCAAGSSASCQRALESVRRAVASGINLVHAYGGSESVVGEALSKISRKGVIHCLTLRYTGTDDYAPKRLVGAIDASLLRMNVQHVDVLFLDTDHVPSDQAEHEVLPALQKIVSSGKVRFLGAISESLDSVRQWLRNVELNAMFIPCGHTLQRPISLDAVSLARRFRMGLIAGDPLAGGLFAADLPLSVGVPHNVRVVRARASEYCRRRGLSLAKLAMQYALLHPEIASHLLLVDDPQSVDVAVAAINEPVDRALLRDVLAMLQPLQNVEWAIPKVRPGE